jgi:hypothetical protein
MKIPAQGFFARFIPIARREAQIPNPTHKIKQTDA